LNFRNHGSLKLKKRYWVRGKGGRFICSDSTKPFMLHSTRRKIKQEFENVVKNGKARARQYNLFVLVYGQSQEEIVRELRKKEII
jgi:hypothetical protein